VAAKADLSSSAELKQLFAPQKEVEVETIGSHAIFAFSFTCIEVKYKQINHPTITAEDDVTGAVSTQ
jgi:hypothetical protein